MATDSLGQPFPAGSVLLPEISPDAHLHMTIDGLEALEAAYGDDYLQHCFDRLDTMTISVVKTVAGLSAKNCSPDQLLQSLRIDEISKRLADALSLSINGRTVAEELDKRQADAIAQMERVRALREAMEGKNGQG